MTDMRISIHVMDVPKEGTPPEVHITFTPLDHEEIVEASVVAVGRWDAESLGKVLSELGAAITENAEKRDGPRKPKRFNPRPT